MNFADYLSSRYVSSQIALTRTKNPRELAENQSIRFLMWSHLTLTTGVSILKVFLRYLTCFVTGWPKTAEQIGRDFQEMRLKQAEQAEKISKEIMKDATKAAVESGNDPLIAKGNA